MEEDGRVRRKAVFEGEEEESGSEDEEDENDSGDDEVITSLQSWHTDETTLKYVKLRTLAGVSSFREIRNNVLITISIHFNCTSIFFISMTPLQLYLFYA